MNVISGDKTMYSFETSIRVRYAETDQMGYVYYGNYAAYYEVARVEMLRNVGWPYRSLEEKGIMMPVTELHTEYIRPAHYDEKLKIRVMVSQMPSVRIRFDYEIYNEGGDLVNRGYTTLVFVDMQKNKPCRAPQEFLDKLSEHGVVA